MTAIQVIPKDRRALSMLKLLADMGIITMEISTAPRGSLAHVLADVRDRPKPAMSMDEIVAVVKDVRAKHRTGGRKKVGSAIKGPVRRSSAGARSVKRTTTHS